MQEAKFLFYTTSPSKENTGLKLVLWEVTAAGSVTHDWGFAFWEGESWEAIETPEGVTAKVVRWANTIDPAVLMSENKIIRL